VSFESGLLGHGRRPAEAKAERLRAFKVIIYDGNLKALGDGVPSETSAILVDQTCGEAILADARARGLATCAPLEKSGQPNFDFEYGDDLRRRLDDAAPTFAKALVRYNPEGDQAFERHATGTAEGPV
jgi:5-dehydro-2-deoxygluconokinase